MISKEQECALVSDLLPLYVEKRTGEAGSAFVREHLEGCEKCRRELAFMEASYEILGEDGGEQGTVFQTCATRQADGTGPGRNGWRGRGKSPWTELPKNRLKKRRLTARKYRYLVWGYLAVLAGIWLYLIFGLFWGVM